MPTYTDQPVVVGDSADFQLYVALDDAVWDITGATVYLYVMDPLGNVTQYLATVSDGPAGRAYYADLPGFFDAAGTWRYWWFVNKAGVKKWTVETELEVYRNAIA